MRRSRKAALRDWAQAPPLGGSWRNAFPPQALHLAQKADEHADTAQIAQALRELKALVDEGILSQAEFEAKKKHLLGL